MRYAILNEGSDTVAHFGDFQPTSGVTSFSAEAGTRYSDAQLYALALYIESLKPPPNPNRFDAHARRGQEIFRQQGCIGCHAGRRDEVAALLAELDAAFTAVKPELEAIKRNLMPPPPG